MTLSDEEMVKAEANEKHLDALIRHRHDDRLASAQAEGERAVEDLWEKQERLKKAEEAQLNRAQWAAYHQAQAQRLRASLGSLAAFHESCAARLLGGPQAGAE